jgi:hypothetical protein
MTDTTMDSRSTPGTGRSGAKEMLAVALPVFFIVLVLYLLTVAPGLTWKNGGDDGGDLVTAAYTGGLPHPPGYPTYTLAARLAIALQDGPIAGRTNRLSAYAGALAAALVALLARRCIRLTRAFQPALAWLASVLAGLVYATTPLAWGQAVITEVYALSAVFILAVVLLGLWLSDPLRRGEGGQPAAIVAVGLGVIAGLGFGAHATILFAVLFAVLNLVLSNRRSLRLVLPMIIGAVIGLLIFLILPLEANRSVTSNWGNPSTLAGFLWVAGAEPYRSLVQWGIFPSRILFLIQLWLGHFTLIGVLLSIYGFWVLWERRRPLALASLLTIVANVQYTTMYYAQDILPYLLVTYALLAAWLGVGVYSAASDAATLVRRYPRAAAVGVCMAIILMVGYLTIKNYGEVDASQAMDAETYGNQIVEQLPSGAVILSNQTRETFALWYAQAVSHRRPDVVVLDVRMLAWDWYRQTLIRFYPDQPFTLEMLSLPPPQLITRLTSGSTPIFAAYDPQVFGISAEPVSDAPLFRLRQSGS